MIITIEHNGNYNVFIYAYNTKKKGKQNRNAIYTIYCVLHFFPFDLEVKCELNPYVFDNDQSIFTHCCSMQMEKHFDVKRCRDKIAA